MFSLSWFTTIPGILITVGVLMLIASLVIFIITSRKNKDKTNKGGSNMNMNNNNNGNNNSIPIPAPAPNIVTNAPQNTVDFATAQMPNNTVPIEQAPPIENLGVNPMPTPYTNSVNPIPLDNTQQVMMPESANSNIEFTNQNPVVNNIEQPAPIQTEPFPTVTINQGASMDTTNITPINNMETTIPTQLPQNDNITINTTENVATVSSMPETSPQVTEVPTITPMTSTPEVETQPQVEATVNISDIPSVEQVIPEMQTNVNNQPVEVEQPSIYGGATPTIPTVSQDVNTHQIYGGANPLESTQQVPISQIAGNINTTRQDMPIDNEPIAPTITVPNVSATPPVMPTVQQTQITTPTAVASQPEVQPNPVINEVPTNEPYMSTPINTVNNTQELNTQPNSMPYQSMQQPVVNNMPQDQDVQQ